tara:strand:+ start:230 stop:925 length:696 start_codon:yes stop_codon:yes gene_type:complete
MIVAFMGVGGSGKTTNARLFYQLLKKANIEVEYRTEFDYVILKPITRLIEKKMPSVRSQFTEISSKKKPSYFKLWPFILWLDFLLLWLSIRFNSKKTFVFDRYIHDFLPAWEFLDYNNKIMRLFYLKFPKPDIVFYIDVDPKVAVDRKYGNILSQSYQNDIVKFYSKVSQYYEWMIKYLDIPKVKSGPTIQKTFSQILYYLQKRSSTDSSINDLITRLESSRKSRNITNND